MVVKSELEKLDLHHTRVELGEVEVMEDLSTEQLNLLNRGLKQAGLELMEDKRSMLVERIKIHIIELLDNQEEQIKVNLSDYLSDKLNHNYTYLANLFSEVKGTTIEKFYLNHKIEKVKELLVYDELNLTEIAWQMNYCSVSHLSNQFKKVTGLSPSHYKQLKDKRRKAIEDI